MSAMATATAPANFDPFNQDFTLIDGNGNEIVANMGIVDQARLYGMRTAINHGTQVGASFMLLLVLLLLTRREKRRSWIFIMNAICLVINTIDSLLTCIYFTGNFFNIYSTLTGDTSRDTATDRGVSIAANTLTLILYICIMVSLSMQVWVVCVTAAKLQRLLIMGATTVIATIAIGYRFAVTVISNHTIMNGTTMKNHNGVLRINYIFQAIAIWAYCCVFTFKLGFALLQRHKLGMTQFGPMQVIFIMGAQCMIIPAIFTCLEFQDTVPELGSQALTVICLFLPLSAIWAGVIANDPGIASNGADAHQHLLKGQFGRSTLEVSNFKGSTIASSLGTSPESPTSYKHGSVDDGHIHVNREWAIDNDKAEASNSYGEV